jgi:1,4-alpha-glucan branching enzyme
MAAPELSSTPRTPSTDVARLIEARHHDPYAVLGPHRIDGGWVVRVFRPQASAVELDSPGLHGEFRRIHPDGMFEWRGPARPAHPYRLWLDEGGRKRLVHDPYAFPIAPSDDDLYLFAQGRLIEAHRMLGAHRHAQDGVTGIRFAVWAPNAERVSVVGDFNGWDGRVHPMRVHGSSGVWMLFVPDLEPGALYKFELRNRETGSVFVKTDPYARSTELRPGTASIVEPDSRHGWADVGWMERRARLDWLHAPCSIYEVHLGSWRRRDGRFVGYRDLADTLVPYVRDMGYTHVELLPISEHPLDESWGYQATGYFAPTSRYGGPDDLRALIDAFHAAGIGVILDWVPAHFPRDHFALAHFDGTALYEHADPRLGLHRDWGTHIFNFGRNEVVSFLLSSAYYWLDRFHFDGLRVDAVASMLYLDYSRREGEWLPNRYGGRENLEAIEFLRALNVMVHERFPGALTFAEESTAWPMVSRPVHLGGLGFSMKWNMGWMNDTLRYIHHDPIHRRFHHGELTFGQLYAYTENFVLPFSHDEVVHGKGSLLGKMPGDGWQQFANLRLLLAYQATTPGKKLNFMGNEFGQGREWSEARELDWELLQQPLQRGVQALCRDLNRLHREVAALHELDFDYDGFRWVDCHDSDQSVLSFLRYARDRSHVVVVLNFTPVVRHGYRIGVPEAGRYIEILNTDSAYFGGSNVGNGAGLDARADPWMGLPGSVELTLPPLACVVLRHA